MDKFSSASNYKRRMKLNYLLQFAPEKHGLEISCSSGSLPDWENNSEQAGRAYARGRMLSGPPTSEADIWTIRVCRLTQAENEEILLLWGDDATEDFLLLMKQK